MYQSYSKRCNNKEIHYKRFIQHFRPGLVCRPKSTAKNVLGPGIGPGLAIVPDPARTGYFPFTQPGPILYPD